MAEAQLPQKVQKDPVLTFLDSKKDALLGAMPRSAAGITWDSILQGVWLALDKSPRLRECPPRTIFASMLYILRLGLDPSGQTGEAYLIPYKGVCTPQLGAYGKLRLAQRYGGLIGTPAVEVVCENDDCDWDNARNWLTHKQAFGDRGKPLFIYFRAWVKGGVDRATGLADIQELMSWQDFEQIREQAKAKNQGKLSPAYANWPFEMAKRSAISRGVKRIDKSPDLLNLIADASAGYEMHAKVRRREAVIDESGSVIVSEEFSPMPEPEPMAEIGEASPDFVANSEAAKVVEQSKVPTEPKAPKTAKAPKVVEAPPPLEPVKDPETGEIVPEQEELAPTTTATPPKAGGQTKMPGMK